MLKNTRKARTTTATAAVAPTVPTFAELLAQIVNEPGRLLAAYSRFHNYSFGNMLLAMSQCEARGIMPGPLATYNAWAKMGRQVRKGEKAIWLLQPQTVKFTTEDAVTGEDKTGTFTKFFLRPRWFVMSQTDGDAVTLPAIPEWNAERALAALDIKQIPFALMDGNALGYATGRSVAVSEVCPEPFKTLIHEIAHVVLCHTAEGDMSDGAEIRRDVREVEAESVAYIVAATLEQGGALEYSRGYVQHWLKGNEISDKTAARIFKAADTILKAGRPAVAEAEAEAA